MATAREKHAVAIRLRSMRQAMAVLITFQKHGGELSALDRAVVETQILTLEDLIGRT